MPMSASGCELWLTSLCRLKPIRISIEEKTDVFAVSINAGFASADVARIGPTVLVTGQGDFEAHIAFAETIADDIWNRRFEVLTNDYLSGSFGPIAVLRVDGIEILVVTRARQILDLQQFKAFGIDPQSKSVVALKSMQHFRFQSSPTHLY